MEPEPEPEAESPSTAIPPGAVEIEGPAGVCPFPVDADDAPDGAAAGAGVEGGWIIKLTLGISPVTADLIHYLNDICGQLCAATMHGDAGEVVVTDLRRKGQGREVMMVHGFGGAKRMGGLPCEMLDERWEALWQGEEESDEVWLNGAHVKSRTGPMPLPTPPPPAKAG